MFGRNKSRNRRRRRQKVLDVKLSVDKQRRAQVKMASKIAGIVLALGCLWFTRWYAQSQLCAEVEAECAAHGKQVVAAPESSESSDSKESA